MSNIYKYQKYPNPLWMRENFQLLDGEWDFEITESTTIPNYSKKINVPFTYETKRSGINDQNVYTSVWYHTSFTSTKKHLHLVMLGSDYQTIVYVNGKKAITHSGGYTIFRIDLSKYLVDGKNELDIHVTDSLAKWQLRGKQRAREESYECWYIQTTGIYKSVYLEEVPKIYFENAKFTGNCEGKVEFDISMNRFVPVEIELYDPNQSLVCKNIINTREELKGTFTITNPTLWSIGKGNLYTVKLKTVNEEIDCVKTYFGFRTIETKNRSIYLNKEKIYQKLILNQGYYKDTNLSIPSVDELKNDIEMIQQLGFNGFRMHQKIEVPHGYYFADELGLLVWAEIPSVYEESDKSKDEVTRDSTIILEQLYNSPSIITIVLFNESWGVSNVKDSVETQKFIENLLLSKKVQDPTRLYIANDGWHQLTTTDILSLHEYEQNPQTLYKNYKDFEYVLNELIVNNFGKCFANNQHYNNQPIIISEFGGVSFNSKGWGYGSKAQGIEEYHKRISDLFLEIERIDYLSGYCYTQFTNVEQETNGLLDENHQLILSAEQISSIVEGKNDKK